ncbi:lysM and putative peptidoglycan-binding domain-containing protein 2-like isoform X1 [Euwallacea fornicatus]|uniref:lysM and putative peptidoglycan-binding domain-containing protein 2-like isoform X1 n=2 Tax=Euwallacea fornicatus TaxID=995702 RepID=UPI00338F52E2
MCKERMKMTTKKKVEVAIPMSLLSFGKSMDRGSYEKLSIRDSARSLKKYGSTSSKHSTRNESYFKHFVSNTDTLQGIALRYNATIEQIRRANKLWASDSLFLREFLLIPQSDDVSELLTPVENQPASSQSSLASPVSVDNLNQNCSTSVASNNRRSNSSDDENIGDFLSKIDASIASMKEVVKKVTSTSQFGSDVPSADQHGRRPQSRLKQQHNNNLSMMEPYTSGTQASVLNTVVTVQQGKQVRTSLELHEQQQAELFEL